MRIETERLILREFAASDAEAVLGYQSDPRYLRFYRWESRSLPDVEAFVRMFLDWQAATPRRRFQLAIALRGEDGGEGPLVGNCGIRILSAEDREAEFGCELDARHWGQGYATEAGRAMLRFAFDDLGLHRVRAECVADNTASARMLERLGFRPEGRLRENLWMKGRWWDTCLFALLETDRGPS
jgi:ribosomal-protein-alanine N-acetyltransferase